MEHPIRIVLADDHPVVRIGVRNMLTQHAGFEVVGEADDGDEAITQTLELKPDILLLDVAIPASAVPPVSKMPWPALCRPPSKL